MALAALPAPPVVDEVTECGRCEQVRPISWTDDDEVTYCEECVNAIMTDLHADIARTPVVDEAEVRDQVAAAIDQDVRLLVLASGTTAAEFERSFLGIRDALAARAASVIARPRGADRG